MKLALKNLIISEVTCQEWKPSENLTKPELEEEEKKRLYTSCNIEIWSQEVSSFDAPTSKRTWDS